MTAHDAYAALRNPPVRRLAIARCSGALGQQIMSVTVGWQLYERTHSAWALGFVGLFQLLPVLLFTIPAGTAADRFPRRNVGMAAQAVLGIASLGLMAVSWLDAPTLLIYALLLMVGSARAFSTASVATFLPQLLPAAQFANANAWVTSATQFAQAAGPALGGLIIAWTGSATWAFFAAAAGNALLLVAFAGLPAIKPRHEARSREIHDLFVGFSFIRRTPVFLAAITLDMFAVLLGGAVALLPIFAKDILDVGAAGLGWLRAALPAGSVVMALTMTRLKPWRRPGRVLLGAVAAFGIATIAFGVSRSFALSLICMLLAGAFNSVSVVVRSTLEQMVTPDRLRGRVHAISFVFVGFSNEFGAFESGSTAALFGPVASVVGGGIGTIAVVTAVAAIWPILLRIGPLASLKPSEQVELDAESEVRHAV